jgi:hypothetical protein
MDWFEVVKDPYISRYGSVCRGFRNSVKLSTNSVLKCLEAIQLAQQAPPDNIFVTGHSLGGALAVHFSSAMVLGQHTGYVAQLLPNWPWHKLQLITYGSPIVGGRSFRHAFNMSVNGVRIWVRQDLITQSKRHFHVGNEASVSGGYRITGTEPHQPSVIRESLIRKLHALSHNNRHLGYDLTQIPNTPPWRNYRTFLDMYNNDTTVNSHLPDLLTNQFADSTDLYADILREFSMTEAKQTLQDGFQRGNVNGAGGAILGPLASVQAKLDILRQRRSDLSASAISHLGLCIALRDLVLRSNHLTMADFQANNTILRFLNS